MNNRGQAPLDLGDDADYSETIVIDRKSKKVSQVFVADPELIQQLVDMGFAKVDADTALTHTKNNLELAVEFLSNNGIPEPRPVSTPAARPTISATSGSIASSNHSNSSSGNPPTQPEMTEEEVAIHKHGIRMKYLKDMGFERGPSERALAEANNDMNAALTLLLNEA